VRAVGDRPRRGRRIDPGRTVAVRGQNGPRRGDRFRPARAAGAGPGGENPPVAHLGSRGDGRPLVLRHLHLAPGRTVGDLPGFRDSALPRRLREGPGAHGGIHAADRRGESRPGGRAVPAVGPPLRSATPATRLSSAWSAGTVAAFTAAAVSPAAATAIRTATRAVTAIAAITAPGGPGLPL